MIPLTRSSLTGYQYRYIRILDFYEEKEILGLYTGGTYTAILRTLSIHMDSRSRLGSEAALRIRKQERPEEVERFQGFEALV